MRTFNLIQNLKSVASRKFVVAKQFVVLILLMFSLSSCKKSVSSADDEFRSDSNGIDIFNKNLYPISDNSLFSQRGLEYALTTQAVLGKNLMQSIAKSGTIGAMSFCNERAYPLTDSMSIVHNAVLKRVTDKPRNPKNQANFQELEYITKFKEDVNNKKSSEPLVVESQGKVSVYYPILTNNLCLQCHGKPDENVESLTIAKIKTLYPNDKATGYNINEVRGLWSVTFDR